MSAPPRLRARALRAIAGGLALGCLIASPVMGWRQGPPGDRVLVCGFGPSCADITCHDSYSVDFTALPWRLEQPSGLLPGPYVPGRRYPLRLVIDERASPFGTIYGFELAPIVGCPFPVPAGDVIPIDTERTRRFEELGLIHLSHRCTCPSQEAWCCGFVPESEAHLIEWSFLWDAPSAQGLGDVTFALGMNAANFDGTREWDRITHATATIPEDLSCPPRVADLRVARSECAGAGTESLAFSWTATGATHRVRRVDDIRSAPRDRAEWSDQGTGTCLPMPPEPLVFYSIAEDCAAAEGIH